MHGECTATQPCMLVLECFTMLHDYCSDGIIIVAIDYIQCGKAYYSVVQLHFPVWLKAYIWEVSISFTCSCASPCKIIYEQKSA